MERYARPSRGPDQAASNRIRDTGQRDELMNCIAPTELVERELERPREQAVESETPVEAVDTGRNGVDVDAIVAGNWRHLQAGSWSRLHSRFGVWKIVGGRPDLPAWGIRPAPSAKGKTQTRG